MKLFQFLTVFFALTLYTFAQNEYVLTIEESVNLALKNSKNLKIAESKVFSAEAKLQETNTQLYPTLKLTSGYTRLSEVEPFKFNFQGRDIEISPTILNNYQIRFGIQYPIFTGFRLENTSKMMELNAKASEKDYESERTKIVYDVKTAYWSIKNLESSLKSVYENIRQVQAHLTDIENFYKNGMATENDVLKVRVQLSNLELAKLDIENTLNLSRINFCIMLGIPATSTLTLTSEINPEIVDYADLNKLLELAYRNRPELQAMELRKEASQKAISIARSGWYPQILLGANYYYNRPNQRLMPLQDKFYGTWDFGITLSYDIWNWMSTKYQTQQAEASYYQSDLGYQQVKDGITLEVSQNYFAYLKAKEKIKVAKENVLQAEENYRVTNEKFKNGLVASSELLDAEVALLNAKISYNNSLLEFEIAKAKLEKSINFVK
ncbi:TolC family protein [Bacteroidetes/Chlorobi group bacterium Naka2016]|jgi:outer membrane protein TolC|nr:MAG: TolC family protein [Bacteroidetes/Chlorobi group bacterium Naka2016]